MEDVSKLVLKVESKQVKHASKNLKDFYNEAFKAEKSAQRLRKSNKGAEKSFVGLGSSITPTIGIMGALVAAGAGVNKVFAETKALQDYRAQLKTATGSAEEATIAFGSLEEFAAKTPYALEQSVQAFIKLKNLGLEPSERALMSYGNTASAMGKDLSQFIEAVADATTSEFERLKEFGIKAKQQGDKVSFTFKGMTQTIGNNAEDIENFLINLGETNFDGAMTDRMETIGGAASNFSDMWDKLFRSVGDGAIGELMKDSLMTGAEALGAVSEKVVQLNNVYNSLITNVGAFIELSGEERKAYIQSVEAKRLGISTLSEEEKAQEKLREIESRRAAGLEAMAIAEKNLKREFLEGEKKRIAIHTELEEVNKRISEGRSKNISADIALYKKLRSESVKLAIEEDKRLTKIETDSSEEKLKARAALEDLLSKKRIERMIQEREYKTLLLDLEAKYYTLQEKFRTGNFTTEEVKQYKSLEEQIKSVQDAESEYLETNMQLKQERLELDKKQAEEQKKLAEKKIQAQKKEFNSLRKSLRTEEEAIEESYKNRLEIILKNTEEGTTERLDLIERLENEKAEQTKSLMERRNKDIKESNNELKNITNNVFDDMGESILRFTKGGEFSVKSMADSILDQLQRLAVESAIIAPLKNAFGTQTPGINGGSSGSGFLGSIFQAGFSAFAANHNGGVVGQTTMTRNVSPSAFSGATRYHTGGIAGMKPDEVPTVLQRGEEVLTKDDPRHRYNNSGGGGTTVNIINESGGQVETQQRQNGNESIVDVIIKQAESFIGTNLSNGRGIGPIIERKYNLSPTLGT